MAHRPAGFAAGKKGDGSVERERERERERANFSKQRRSERVSIFPRGEEFDVAHLHRMKTGSKLPHNLLALNNGESR